MSDTIPPNPATQASTTDTPMSLDEARRVIWQTQPKEPMGRLLDQGRLSRKDLEWAIKKAYRLDVRRAAHRLLQELDHHSVLKTTSVVLPLPGTTSQLPANDPPRYGARVVIASEYLENQEAFHGWMLAYYIGLGIGALFLTVSTITWLLLRQPLWLTVLSIVGNIVVWVWLILVVRDQLAKVRSFHVGRKGEEQVVEQLRTALDHCWTIYRNLQLPDHKSDLDLVLVGPGGVWVVQIKATSAPLRVQAGRWEVKRGGRWVAAQPDPAKQVTSQATALNDFLKRQGINRFVERAIALAEAQPFDKFADSPIPVWLPFDVAGRAQALDTKIVPASGEITRINEVLGKRADAQRVIEATRNKFTR